MSGQKATDRLAEVVQQYAGKPGSQRVSMTLGELRDLNARIAWLTDGLVAAAALHFGEIKNQSEADYASEELHETALDLVRENLRLKGAFKGDGS